jgi:galactose mutarotase-like enzyme
MVDKSAHVLRNAETTVHVFPSRGALIAGLNVDGVELLYLEKDTLESPTGAVRGGIPLLFPFGGELADGRLAATNTEMPRHGFGRRKAWDVTRQIESSLTMRLLQDAGTRAQYPFEFDVEQTVTATRRGIQIELTVENLGTTVLPMAPGWHPYFPCPVDEKLACLRQVLPEHELQARPVACDVNVPVPAGGRVEFTLAEIGQVAITCSARVKTLEIWTLPDRPFVCIEPWVGPTNVINTPKRIDVAPGTRVTLAMGIERLL